MLLERVERRQEGRIQIENWPMPFLLDDEKNNERRQICQSLGFTYQDSMPSPAPLPLSHRDRVILRAALPTTYSYRGQPLSRWGQPTAKPWGAYVYDLIPLVALRKIDEAVASRFFTDVQIWTPEKMFVIDPIAVGERNGEIYPITRWGEALVDSAGIAAMAVNRICGGWPLSEETKEHIVPFLWDHHWIFMLAHETVARKCENNPCNFWGGLRPYCRAHSGYQGHFHHWTMGGNPDLRQCAGIFCSHGDWNCGKNVKPTSLKELTDARFSPLLRN